MLSIKATLQLIGWVLVFLFPLVVVYYTGGIDKEPLLDDVEYRRREAKKKQLLEKQQKEKEQAEKQQKEQAEKQAQPVKKRNNKKKQTAEEPQQVQQAQSKKKKNNNKKQAAKQEPAKKEIVTEEEPVKREEEESVKREEESVKRDEPVKEIDEHMDPTVNYARVLRIKPEEVEDEYDSVPAEDGWSQVKSRRPTNNTRSSSSYVDNNAAISEDSESTSRYIPGLDKKQRENMKRSAKKKQQKAAADALQEERLRKHQKELEKIRIQEFYSNGKGKNTPWGKNGSSKRPTSTASINEHGQLIWD